MARLSLLVLAVLFVSGCNCGDTRLTNTRDVCELTPELCDAGLPLPPPDDAGFVEAADSGVVDAGVPCTDLGAVSGRVCAPDQMTWVNGAAVSIDATDCHGQPVHLETTSAADGAFSLRGVPPGSWTVHASLGAFTQDTPVSVRANASTAIPDNQLCVAQRTVRIAVVTGAGDKIEDLLTALNLQFTLFGGDSSTWTTQAGPFLSDLAQMKQYDLIFVDCAAAKAGGTTIDLGTSAAAIESNLAAYVRQGGSVYSSDWALLFTLAAAPSAVSYATQGGGAISNPLDARQLMGYAPQTVTATVRDAALAQFLGKSSLNITFPKQTGANSLHWGLMSSTPNAQVLVSAPSVVTCPNTTCGSPGPTRANVPLAVRVRVLPPGTKGGNIVYTSFHNVAQTGTDVAQVLKYLVLNL